MSDTTAAAILMGMGVSLLFLMIAWYVIQIIAYWKIFTKAGEAGWKSIIPFYNAYIQYKLTWNTMMFFVVFVCGVVGYYVNSMDGAISILGWIMLTAATILGGVIANYKLARAFGHGVGFTIGLILLQPIFILILGFGGDKYQGPQ